MPPTMSSPPSSSDQSAESNIELLDERIRRWIWEKGWTSLRDAQERAIPVVLEARRDVVIAAATAAGKTEAAFLPILSRLLQNGEEIGLALYISPLKALINDQWGRLEQLCESLEIPVVPWHGDVASSKKQKFLRHPRGVLLITPESLEAMFVRRGSEIVRLFGEIDYVVVDELHAFIGSDRGKQLQSLLCRIEGAIGRRVPRIGLSATLGDMNLAAHYLRPIDPEYVVIESKSGNQDLRIQLRGYEAKAIPIKKAGAAPEEEGSATADLVADHLYQVLRGSNNLLFPNSRNMVEYYSDLLRRRCEHDGVPNEFWPHHGSLSREIREDTERALKAGDRPATAVCTTTLELGIDIGAVKSVAQIGPPPSVAALRQRLGRSGRRPGEPAILRAYAIEDEVDQRASVSDRLREGLVQTTASIRLLLRGWFEPPQEGGLHLSTLVQQILSMIAERGGASATQIYRALIENGPFAGLGIPKLTQLMRELGHHDLIVQDSSGLLLLGEEGEKRVNAYDFYAAFQSPEEWQILHEGQLLGTLPINNVVIVGTCIIFAGRRWRVLSVASDQNILSVAPDPGGKAPKFDSGRPATHDGIRWEMRVLLEEQDTVRFLDTQAQTLLDQARRFYREARLGSRQMLVSGNDIDLLTWRGDRVNNALQLMLKARGIPAVDNEGLVLACRGCSEERLLEALVNVVNTNDTDLVALLRETANLRQGKWDWALPDELLVESYTSLNLDLDGAQAAAQQIIDAAQTER